VLDDVIQLLATKRRPSTEPLAERGPEQQGRRAGVGR
jgi:hypothetical protein